MKADELVDLPSERPVLSARLHISMGHTHEMTHPEPGIVRQQSTAPGADQIDGRRPSLSVISVSHSTEVKQFGVNPAAR